MPAHGEPQIEMACPQCGMVSVRYASQSKGFCGPKCYHEWTRLKYFKPRTQIEITCAECGRVGLFAKYYQGIRKYCSRKCYSAALQKLSGGATAHWKGGRVAYASVGRWTVTARQWRESVLTRDGNKCTKCGATAGLHVHHIKSYTLFPALRRDIANGLTLCRGCHYASHRGVSRVRRAA